MDGASKSTLENEFGTSNEDECLIKILEKGDLQGSEVSYPSCAVYQDFVLTVTYHRLLSVEALRMTARGLEWPTRVQTHAMST